MNDQARGPGGTVVACRRQLMFGAAAAMSLLLASAGGADDAPAAPQEQAEALTADQIAERFEAYPASIALQRRVQFNRALDRRLTYREMRVTLEVEHPADMQVVSHQGLVIDEVVMSDGHRLGPPPGGRGGTRTLLGFDGGTRRDSGASNSFNVSTQLGYPVGTPESIERLTASVDATVVSGEPVRVEIGPYSAIRNRTARLADVEGATIRVAPHAGRILVNVSPELAARLVEIGFESAEGEALDAEFARARFGGRDGQSFDATVDLPADGQVVLMLRPHSHELTIPIELTDVSMPMPPEPQQEIVIEASDRPLSELLGGADEPDAEQEQEP